MKTYRFLLTAFLASLLFTISCSDLAHKNESSSKTTVKEKTNQNRSNAPIESRNDTRLFKGQGVYQGILPCTDCEGVKNRLILSKDGFFTLTLKYLGKHEKSFVEKGTFKWDPKVSVITLFLKNGKTRKYRVERDTLYQLNQHSNRIKGELTVQYKLIKNDSDPAIENKTWVLTELMGQPVKPADNEKRRVSLIFNSTNGMVSGFNGCNRFAGDYELFKGNRFRIGKLVTSQMACRNMEKANQFMKAIEKADNYTITHNVLSISKGRMAILAKFKVIK